MKNEIQYIATVKSTFCGKILAIIFVCLISAGAIAQDITNTLAPNGKFIVKDASNNYLVVDQLTGQVNVLKTLKLENTTSPNEGVIFMGSDRFIHNYGTDNIFIGINSGNFTLTGYSNTALGVQSLYSNTSAFGNTALGYNSLYSNTIGTFNTAVGYRSLKSNTTGVDNVALGCASLMDNTTGNANTAVGYFSLRLNTTGGGNTAVGVYSLSNNTIGMLNTAVGHTSLFLNTSGQENTAVGYQSLYYNTTGNHNTAVGFHSLKYNTTGHSNTAVGDSSLYSNTTGTFNTAVGNSAGNTITTGSNLVCLGFGVEPTTPDATNQITLGNNQITSLRCNVQTITSLSDARDKKNIKDLNLGIDFLMKIKPRLFNWDRREWYDDNISDGSKIQEEPTAGFVAQELDEAQTTAQAEWLNLVLKDNPEKWEATPGNLLPIVVKAIQELKVEKDIEIAKLKSENGELKKEVASLKSMSEKLVTLEQMVNTLSSYKQASFSVAK